jgi:transcriptional repressor NF-X1
MLAGGNFRDKCTDPIPTCEGKCNKTLPCKLHKCKENCHEVTQKKKSIKKKKKI